MRDPKRAFWRPGLGEPPGRMVTDGRTNGNENGWWMLHRHLVGARWKGSLTPSRSNACRCLRELCAIIELAVSNVPADYFRHFMSSRFGYAAAGSVRVGVARPDLSHHWCRVPS